MALSGLAIYKLLAKTNCKECGYPTCLAFAMKLAAKQAELSDCPYVSEEAKAALGECSAPPIRLVKIGEGDRAVEVGNETVMFRHEDLRACAGLLRLHQRRHGSRGDRAPSEGGPSSTAWSAWG